MSRIKRIILTAVASFGLLAPALVVAPVTVFAQDAVSDTRDALCAGAELRVPTKSDDCTANQASETGVNTLITNVINIFSLIVGVVAVIMIIIGGLKYITSGGDSGNVTGAKNTILYAVVGLIVVALAQVIVRFVLQQTATII